MVSVHVACACDIFSLTDACLLEPARAHVSLKDISSGMFQTDGGCHIHNFILLPSIVLSVIHNICYND
jgi:hypothetical protein